MKRIGIGLLAFLMCISVLLCIPQTADAAGSPIDRVHIEVDVPVDGVSLKSTAVVHEFIDSQNMEMKEANTASEVVAVYWYKTTEPGDVLSSGYKAKSGESYNVSVVLKAKEGYSFAEDINTKSNLLNGKSTDVFSGTMANGDSVWIFDGTLSTISAASGKPIVTIKDMQLSPYEGNPMEVVVEVSNATNVKYQWQITYGDDGDWGGEVDLDDNAAYVGTKTPHFKIHSFFGDTFDEDLNFAKVQCKVTSDNGTAYSQQVWYTLRERETVNGFSLNGLDTPSIGKTPDYQVDSADSSKYYAQKVIWYGPKAQDGTYPLMNSNSTFKEGEYNCKILVAPEDAYKIDDDYYGVVDGKNYIITTVQGKNQVPYGPDTYYVNVPFKVDKITISQISANVMNPEIGGSPAAAVSTTQGVTVTETEWYKGDSRGRYTALEDGETFESDTSYRCDICVKLEDGYAFAEIMEAVVNGKTASFSMLKGTDYRWINYYYNTEAAQPGDPVDPPVDPVDPPVDIVNPFVDVAESDWFYESVMYVYSKGLMTGLTPTTFGPVINLSRAQFAVILWRMNGSPVMEYKAVFPDVPEGTWYTDAVLWANLNGIITGYSHNGHFGSADNITREQMALMMYRYANAKSYDTSKKADFGSFKDAASVSEFAIDGMQWAVGNSIITGKDNGTALDPQGNASRAECATIIMRFSKIYED